MVAGQNWGHWRLARCLESERWESGVFHQAPIVAQYTSVGSLGDNQTWLEQFLSSCQAGNQFKFSSADHLSSQLEPLGRPRSFYLVAAYNIFSHNFWYFVRVNKNHAFLVPFLTYCF